MGKVSCGESDCQEQSLLTQNIKSTSMTSGGWGNWVRAGAAVGCKTLSASFQAQTLFTSQPVLCATCSESLQANLSRQGSSCLLTFCFCTSWSLPYSLTVPHIHCCASREFHTYRDPEGLLALRPLLDTYQVRINARCIRCNSSGSTVPRGAGLD